MHKTTTFQCARCGATKTRDWTDEEAYDEYLRVIPREDQTIEDNVMVCTECYVAILIEHGIPVPPEYL